MFPVTVYESLTLSKRKNLDIPPCRILSAVWYLIGFLHVQPVLKPSQSISIGLGSGLWLGHSIILHFFLLNHSLVDLLECFGSLSCCPPPLQVQILDRWCQIFLKHPLIQCRIHSGFYDGGFATVAARQPQTMTFPPPCFPVGIWFLCSTTMTWPCCQ